MDKEYIPTSKLHIYNKNRWVKTGDLDFLKATYMFFSDRELGKMLGRNYRTISNIRGLYGLSRDKPTHIIKDKVITIPAIFILPKNMKSKRENVLSLLDTFEDN